MAPTNNKLIEKSDSFASSTIGDAASEVGVAKEDTVHGLADRWASLNLVRGLLTGASAVLATWAALQPTEVVGIASFRMQTGADRLG